MRGSHNGDGTRLSRTCLLADEMKTTDERWAVRPRDGARTGGVIHRLREREMPPISVGWTGRESGASLASDSWVGDQ